VSEGGIDYAIDKLKEELEVFRKEGKRKIKAMRTKINSELLNE